MPIISPKIPSGLEELMRGLAKSVIKENPQNIYEFAAEYFENLLRERDGSVDQSYKKFATYKVYKKNKNARQKRAKEIANDVNDVKSDNGLKTDGNSVNYAKYDERDSSAGEKSIEEIILPAASQPLLAVAKTSLSSESEINASVKKESSVEIEEPPTPSGCSEDDDIKNMVLDDDMEQAALKIQSTFRGHKARKEVKHIEIESKDANAEFAAEEGEATDPEIKTITDSECEVDNGEIVEEKASQEAQSSKGTVDLSEAEAAREIEDVFTKDAVQSEADDDIANMVMDEDMEQAALKIQSTFRGHKTRREIKEKVVDNNDDKEDVESAEARLSDQNEESTCEISEVFGKAIELVDEIQEQVVEKLSLAGLEAVLEDVQSEEILEDEATKPVVQDEVTLQEAVEDAGKEVVVEEGEVALEATEDINELEKVSDTLASPDIEESEAVTVIEGELEVEGPEEIPAEEEPVEVPAEELETSFVEIVAEETIAVEEIEKAPTSDEASEVADVETVDEASEIVSEAVVEDDRTKDAAAVIENVSNVTEEIVSNVTEEIVSNATEEIKETVEDAANDVEKTVEASTEIVEETVEEVVEAVGEIIKESQEIVKDSDVEENLEAFTGEVEALTAGESTEEKVEVADNVEPETDEVKVEIAEGILTDEEKCEIDEVQAPVEGQKSISTEALEESSPECAVIVEALKNEDPEDDGKIIQSSSIEVADGEKLDEKIEENVNFIEAPEASEIDGNKVEETEVVEKAPETIEGSVEALEVREGEGSVVEKEVSIENEEAEKLKKEGSLIKSSQEILENPIDEPIELAETLKNNNEEGEVVEAKISNEKMSVENVEGSEEEPQKQLSELRNDSEVAKLEKDEALEAEYIDAIPVVEPICEKKSIEDLVEKDQEECEIDEGSPSKVIDQDNVEEIHEEITNNLEKLPSAEIEYSTLKESLSEHDEAAESADEADNKSRDLTDEKSIDGDSGASKQASLDEELPTVENANESLVRALTVDDIEANATQQAENVEELSNDANVVEPLLLSEISPIELMDEVVNEVAGVVANELFNLEHLSEAEALKSSENEETQATETVDPQLSEQNPLKEIEPSKAITLSQESVKKLQDEEDPIIDEILQPGVGESEIPEETQAPMDENIPTVSMDEKVISVEDAEMLPEDEKESEPEPPKLDDDVADMVLDEEMEDAALKIQAAFRGHKVRKVREVDQQVDEQAEEKAEEKSETTVVIDQCSEDVEESPENQDQEETEQQDTSADVEDIQESEEQEKTQEETQDEEIAEEEAAVDSAENETAEETQDDPEGTPEEGEASEQPQNNDDDDVANMVLDEEMEQAALKIQSTFRGHKSRKDIKKDESQGEANVADEPQEEKDAVEEVQEEIANLTVDEENKEEEASKEEPSTSSDKSAKQLQDEEDIAGLVMDDQMEKTALKIQSAFRGKSRKKPAKDGAESGSSAGDQSDEDEEDESPAKSDDDPFRQNEESQERISFGESFYDYERASDYSTAAHYYPNDNASYSVDRYDGSYDYEPMAANTSTDDINLMQGGGIFPEPSAESSDMLTGSSGEDKEPDRNSSYEKVPSDKSFEIDESISQKQSVEQLSDEQVIESFDFDAKKDTAEAMYYSLKKNEIETQKRLSIDQQFSVEKQFSEDDERLSMETMTNMENHSMEFEQQDDEDDDDVVIGAQATSAKRLKYGMSMDDRLLGSILSQDYSAKARKDGYPDDGFDPLLEATMRKHRFLEMSNSDEGKDLPFDGYPGDDEDQFDDFYHSDNIRKKILASSFSIADSDYFDPTSKSNIDDDKIRTALETIHSTDSESTIASAATKIYAGERMTAKRNNNITTQSMQYSSIGNAAIDRSLEEFIQSQELRINRFDEDIEGYNSPPPRIQEYSVDDWTDDTTTYTDSDKKAGAGGVIEIKLEQRASFLTVDERRRTLHREDAIQRNSTREDEDSSKSSNASGEKLLDKQENPTLDTAVATVAAQDSVIDTEIVVPVLDLSANTKASSSQSMPKPQRMKRQHTMPVQIQSDVIRVIPKHLRKRIKSADGEKKKRPSK